jgi:2-iminobutanoate/2-iminopropanoate deaminase
MKRIISAEKAPKAIGPYSQAIETNGVLYISGQVAIDPSTGRLVEGGITAQTRQVLKNIGEILHSAGYDFSDVVKSTVLLDDMENFKSMNEVYATSFPVNPPARATYAVKSLPLGAVIEIESIASK